MGLSFRKSQILEIAREEGRVEVEDLARRLDVSTQTIRRDLSDLSGDGLLDRVHGGALAPQGMSNIGYQTRRAISEDAKGRIGRLCAAEIPDNSSLLLNIGTSTEAVAAALVNHRNLTVVTNNLNVAHMLSKNETFEIIVTGGHLRSHDGGLVGDLAAATIEQFKVDRAVIGTSAMDEDGDLLDFDMDEVRVSRTIIRQSRQTFLVMDQTKLERSAPVRIASLGDLDAIFTDALPVGLIARCEGWNTAVHLAGPMSD